MIGRRVLGWACALGMAACAATPGDPRSSAAAQPASLAGTRWVGVIAGATDPRVLPRLEFAAEGRLSGFTGCNRLDARWTMEGGELRVGSVVTTKRLCLGPAGETEKRVLAALGERGRITREGARLVLVGPGGERLEFTPAAAT